MKSALPRNAAWDAEIEQYCAYLATGGIPKTTIKLRDYHLRRIGHELDIPPLVVTEDDLIEYFKGKSWSASTRRSFRTTLRGFYSWAHYKGKVVEDPARNLPKIAAPLGKPRPAADDAVAAGLKAADERQHLMIELAALAGLRASEIARVNSDDLVRDLLGWSLRVLGKGNKVRIVPVSDYLARRIREHSGWVFPGQDQGHLSGAYVSKLISRALPPGVTAHMLRHRFASRAYSGSGGDIRAVQELLGHASVATTQIYTAISDDSLRRAALAAA